MGLYDVSRYVCMMNVGKQQRAINNKNPSDVKQSDSYVASYFYFYF